MILTLGDSVAWGQGLREEQKFDRILANALAQPLTRLAHSGALLGSPEDDSSQSLDPEVPVPYPSLWQQAQAFADWESVNLVLLTGGMNDVDLRRILDPWSSPAALARATDEVCREAMHGLLRYLAAQLTRPLSRIVVLGYYPILSPLSGYPSPDHASTLLRLHEVLSPSLIPDLLVSHDLLIARAEEHCVDFWKQSNAAFQSAVDAANQALPGRPCHFLPLPFAEPHSMWAPESHLFHLTPDLGPEDPVAEPRGCACAQVFHELLHPSKRFQCDRASAGHPSVAGAARIAQTLAQNLAQNLNPLEQR